MSDREFIAAKINDLKNGQMKSVSIDGNEILLCKIENKFFALGAHCTHYGAPLVDGVLNGDRIVCPWHHACFNARTGDRLEPPANDSLPKYETKIDGDNLIVMLPEKIVGSRLPNLSKRGKNNHQQFVIIGGGAAGYSAAQTLREEGFSGRIILITQEDCEPYDRPNLSKDYLAGDAEGSWIPLRSNDFYDELDIEVMLNKKVLNINFSNKSIMLSDNENIKYNKLLLATGGEARKLKIPGEDLKNVFTLRSFEDSKKIIEASKRASKAVIIGASFIGMETAYSLRKRGLQITVISQEEIPFEKVFGREVGNLFKKLHEDNGVKFRLSFSLKEFVGKEKVQAVLLQNGDRIETDLVVLGVGVKPSTSFLKNLNLLPDGSVKVDEYFKIQDDVFAAGDIATYTDWRTGEDMRIEHWRTAEQQGRIAALNMLDKKNPNKIVPFFWTSQVGLSLNYVGHAVDWQEIIFKGDISSQEFIAFYVKNNKVYAAAGNFRDKDMAAIEELMRLDKMPSPEKLKYDSIDFVKLLSK
ncbi:MAG: FAD-dependent oxidoreductase [Bacteroidetes bacterium]|nr:FAD-dependent oxidoreductase [Bacteroidota bacterium]